MPCALCIVLANMKGRTGPGTSARDFLHIGTCRSAPWALDKAGCTWQVAHNCSSLVVRATSGGILRLPAVQ